MGATINKIIIKLFLIKYKRYFYLNNYFFILKKKNI